MANLGKEIYALAQRLFPLHRSITGEGVRQTLNILKKEVPALTLHEVPSGTKAFDWEVPQEWNIRDAYVLDPGGKKIIDFQKSNLHIMGYSTPADKVLSLEELQNHLYSLPDQPNAIPYITSYYKKRWGFCLTHKQRQKLKPGKYRVAIDSEFKDGSLTYGEILLPGATSKEVFLSTYVCHPSMANNELSGPTVTTFLTKWLLSSERKYTYRIIFIPETIGSIVYLSRNLQEMQKNMVAGFNITCVGDDRAYSFLPSRNGNTLADKAARHVLTHTHPKFDAYTYLDRGSDERQYCSPGVDLPVASIMRSKYGTYPEYHTSLDNLDFISPTGLQGAYEALKRSIMCIERNEVLKTTVLCEPQLGKRGLYPTISTKKSSAMVRDMMNLIAYADGTRNLLEIAEKIQVPLWELVPIVERLKDENVVEEIKNND